MPRGGAFDGLLLAGGASRRFGSDKRMALLGGEPLVRRALATLRQVVTRGTVFVATGPIREQLPGTAGTVVVADEPPGRGPLGGIAAGLRHTQTGIVVLACDLPLVRPATLLRVAGDGAWHDRPAAVRGVRGWEPLVAYYPRWVLNHVRAALSQGVLAPHVLLERLGTIPISVPDRTQLANVNTPGDLETLGEG